MVSRQPIALADCGPTRERWWEVRPAGRAVWCGVVRRGAVRVPPLLSLGCVIRFEPGEPRGVSFVYIVHLINA